MLRHERNDLNNEKRVGFIAKNFEAVLPECYKKIVRTGTFKRTEESEVEEIKTLDYSRIVTILWGALKNSNKRIAALEARVK